MAEVQTKALFTCTEAGYDAALSIMELYRKNGMQAFFYGIAEEADLVSLGEINKMTHVLHFVDEESIRLVSIADEMGGFTVDISINDSAEVIFSQENESKTGKKFQNTS